MSCTHNDYRGVFGKRWLGGIALGCLVLSLLLMGLGLFSPLQFENDIARFVFCVAVATTLSIFFFIFYPIKIQVALGNLVGNWFGEIVRLSGPIALWFIVLAVLWRTFPTPEAGRVFRIRKDGQYGGMYYGDSTTTYLTAEDPNTTPPEHILIGNPDPDESRILYGIYVKFPKNVDQIQAKLHHEGWKEPLLVVLSRTGPTEIDVSEVAKE